MAQVDLVHRVPRLGRRLREAHERPEVADVVHEHVDASVVLGEHRLGERGDLVVLADVDDVRARSVAAGRFDLGLLGGGAVGVDLGDLDHGAVLGEQPGDGAADAVATAGDDGDLALEQALVVGDRGDVGGFLGHGRTLSIASGRGRYVRAVFPGRRSRERSPCGRRIEEETMIDDADEPARRRRRGRHTGSRTPTTLSDLGAVVPREVLEAARLRELENPADESDEG